MDEGRSGGAVSVEFEVTPEDWVELQMEHASRSPLLATNRRNVRGLFALVVVLLSALGLLMGSATVAVTWILAGAVGFAALGPALTHAQRRHLQRHAASGTIRGMFGSHRVELRPDGMMDSTSGYEFLARWEAIEKVVETPAAFMVYAGPNAFLPIPHTAFADAESLRRFSDAFFELRERARTLAPGEPAPEG